MGKSTHGGGKHTTPRINVGVPADWHAVLRRLANKRRQPILYALISLLEEEGKRQKLADMPTPPWDDASGE